MAMMKIGIRLAYRSVFSRSYHISAAAAAAATANQHLLRRHSHKASQTLFAFLSPGFSSFDFGSVLSTSLGSRRSYSEDVVGFPVITDPGLQRAFKDLMAAGWSDLPDSLIKEVKSALSKTTDDAAGKEVVEKVFCAAVAIEEFGAIVMNLKMELDDAVGASGENTEKLVDVWANAIHTLFSRYTAYLESFGPDEVFLLKKVETELGGKMIFLKMRCKGLGAEWAKVSVIATSGLAGSYVEQRS